MFLLCGCKQQPRHTLVTPPPLWLLVLSFHCSPSLCHWQGFSCPSPLLCFVCVFIHAGLCFLGILRCILHALLAGLLIKLCLRAISSDIYQMSSFFNSSVPPVSEHLPEMISCFLLSRKTEYEIKGYVVWKVTDKVYMPEGNS